ncbi:putative 60S ribosome biogenesis protein Brx1 [Talaromyces proteolyticus]|uniref:60S ribosome biogenesis protein Brx1 n=1 Tax=Talaromyces proteolyticus TaxID=1131652 RepID=A0AAD4PWN8_9EURO|nr:putative 60S ribosome biogenesis protein Brx1 [Talaromyces proteolyticus]KAH8698337.1 putative 60S ribosome biogenesis protein Brx1 [Talaromyces proteolyticus]
MASVYKSISKKKQERPVDEDIDDEDIDMEDMLDEDTSDSDEDDEDIDEDGGVAVNGQKTGSHDGTMPKSRVLMLTSRGVTHRHRYLLSDMTALLPHTHKENKLDTKKSGGYNMLLNSLAELHSCNVIFFLEARKHGQDLYLWLARPPNGPTIKFSVTNLHTTGEMGTGFSGNCLKGGRGVVVFDKSFNEKGPEMGQNGTEYRGLIREMLRKVFCVPKRGVRGVKPFIDRIIGVFGVDGKIWIRVYEIRESDGTQSKKGDENEKQVVKSKDGLPDISLVEIGPRFVLTPIVILEGSFGGPVIYENKEYVSPNQVRRDVRLQKASRYAQRRDTQTDHVAKKSTLGLGREGRKRDALDTREVFG